MAASSSTITSSHDLRRHDWHFNQIMSEKYQHTRRPGPVQACVLDAAPRTMRTEGPGPTLFVCKPQSRCVKKHDPEYSYACARIMSGRSETLASMSMHYSRGYANAYLSLL